MGWTDVNGYCGSRVGRPSSMVKLAGRFVRASNISVSPIVYSVKRLYHTLKEFSMGF